MANYGARSIVVKNSEGEIIERYKSVCEASRAFDVTYPTIAFWIKKQKVINGNTIHYEKERIEPKTVTETYVKEIHTLEYKTINGKVCISPCPFLQAPKPMIGSGACKMCIHYIRTLPEQKVECQYSKFSPTDYRMDFKIKCRITQLSKAYKKQKLCI